MVLICYVIDYYWNQNIYILGNFMFKSNWIFDTVGYLKVLWWSKIIIEFE